VSGVNRTVMTLHTIADVFWLHLKGYSHVLYRKKPVLAFSSKKGGVCYEVFNILMKKDV
jgi:hypothetical protein